jgi:UDP-glucose 4-epimerase
MHVLVTGGAGYIGSHVVDQLTHEGYQVTVIDDLSTGLFTRLEDNVEFHKIDVRSETSLENLFKAVQIDAVIHLAAKKSVSESFEIPEEYDEINNVASVQLMKISKKYGCNKFIFSSTAAVYGNGTGMNAKESDPLLPISPYGISKLIAEQALGDLAISLGVRYTALRYFNVAGSKLRKFRDENLSNLIPIVLDDLSKGIPPRIFGGDYDTIDGTCVRDYVHVSDIATAHLKCLELIESEDFPNSINVGSSKGYSVREVIHCAKKVLKSSIEPIVCERRAGDPAELLANNDLMLSRLHFSPKYNLEEIIRSLND